MFFNKKSKIRKLEDVELNLLSIPNFKDDDKLLVKYLDFHTTSVFIGVSWYRELFGNWTNVWGGKSSTFYNEFEYAKREAIKQFKIEVLNRFPECNCVINMRVDFEPVSYNKGVMFAIVIQGQPVIILGDSGDKNAVFL